VVISSQMPVPARHKTQDMNIHAVTGIQTLDPRNQVASDRTASGIGYEKFISFWNSS
jgi:hypothetical protein